ncbi:MAG: hypothetical protein AAB817_02530 [Patescibacteria group bacterium]
MSNRDRALTAIVVVALAISGYLTYQNIQRFRPPTTLTVANTIDQAMTTALVANQRGSRVAAASPSVVINHPVVKQLRYHVAPINLANVSFGRADIFLPPNPRR